MSLSGSLHERCRKAIEPSGKGRTFTSTNQFIAIMSYMQDIDQRLRGLFAEVANDATSVDEAVTFIKDELLASFKRGLQAKPRSYTSKTPRSNSRRRVAKR